MESKLLAIALTLLVIEPPCLVAFWFLASFFREGRLDRATAGDFFEWETELLEDSDARED